MKEQIAYYQRQIYHRNNLSAIHYLGRLKHPDAIDVLIEIAQSDAVNDRVRETVLPILIASGDQRVADMLLHDYAHIYPTSYNILHQIHKLNDRRVVPELIATLYNIQHLRDRNRYGIVAETIAALARIGDERALPALHNLIISYPFESKIELTPTKLFGILAIDALSAFDTAEAKALHDEWQKRLNAHIDFHLEAHTVFNAAKKKVTIDRVIITRPKVLRYLLHQLEKSPLTQQLALIKEIGLKVFPLSQFAELVPSVVEAFLRLAEATPHEDVRRAVLRRLSHKIDERIVPLAISALDDPRLSTYAVKILKNHKVLSIETKIIQMLDADIPNSYEAQFYHHYLGMTGTVQAEQAIIRYIQRTDSKGNLAEAYKVLGKLAQHSDEALNLINQAIESEDINLQKIAIAALSQTGERAIAILLSLLNSTYTRKISAIKALAAPHYADAVPHLMQALLSESIGTTSLILRTLQAIGSEAAFAAINDWDKGR